MIQDNQQYYDQLFTGLSLSETTQASIEFEQCDFNGCDFSATTFSHCKFINCCFTQCNLSLLKSNYSQFLEVRFIDCKMIGIDWTKAHWPKFTVNPELSFTRCILNDSSFFGLTLHELILEECKVQEVDFRSGDFVNSSMTSSDFHNSLFMRTNLQKVDFTDSANFNINVNENNLTKAKFSRYEALSLLESLGIELVD
ncbi:pentapeptide repeat-containing protein [Shewanella sp. ULN5]|nr:pentapeptide repeat-containing protein [Shewanella sp. ULN5]MDP5147130.1 pentapeptide repeat-containing protein [Shewanella sp. ULN5]